MKRLAHPIRAIREPFGTAGLVVAIVALVAALSGGAIAATSDSGQATASAKGKSKAKAKQGPRGKTGKTGPAGPAGPAGPQGAAGAKGDTGAAGANGKDGANGTNGTNGAPGAPGAAGKSAVVTPFDSETEPAGNPCNEFGGAEVEVQDSGEPTNICNGETGFTDTLPPGKTEMGTWAGNIGANEFVEIPISFNIPLAEIPVSHMEPDPSCPGSEAEPKAAPGHFCLYYTEANLGDGVTVAALGRPGGNGAAEFGTVVEVQGPPGKYAQGTWAVTGAPPAP